MVIQTAFKFLPFRRDTQVLPKEPKNATADTNHVAQQQQQQQQHQQQQQQHPPNAHKREMGRRCRVVFSYAPQHDDELGLTVGETINVLQEVEEGWWKGVLNGQVGMFPSNFVEDFSDAEATSGNTTTTSSLATHSTAPAASHNHNSTTPISQNHISTTIPPQHHHTTSPSPQLDAKSQDSLNIINYNNHKNMNGETKENKRPIGGMGYGVKLSDLNLKKDQSRNKGEAISPSINNTSPKILGSSESSAFHPVKRNLDMPKENGQVKDFRELPHRLPPALEPKTGDKPAIPVLPTTKSAKTKLNAADRERINMEKDRITITIGDDKPNGVEVRSKDEHNKAPSAGQPTTGPPVLPPKPVRELARVLFPYGAEHEDELELKDGEIITVLCKELEDKGWWRGEINGKVGVFPDNFVELITVEETAKPPRPEKPAAVKGGSTGSPSSSNNSTPTGTLNKTDKEPPPPLPEKKVAAPPPPEKKPVLNSVSPSFSNAEHKPANNIADNQTPAMQAKKQLKKEDLSLTLDSTEKLKHVTHLRPKGPARRRPPSEVFKENMKNPVQMETVLPPTPEDSLLTDTPNGPNLESSSIDSHDGLSTTSRESGVSRENLSISPSVELRQPSSSFSSTTSSEHPAPTPISPSSINANSPPWLRELEKKQTRRSFHLSPEEDSVPPLVSPKPSGINKSPRPLSLDPQQFKPKPPHADSKPIKPSEPKPSLKIVATEPKHNDTRQPSPDLKPKNIDTEKKPLSPQPLNKIKIAPQPPIVNRSGSLEKKTMAGHFPQKEAKPTPNNTETGTYVTHNSELINKVKALEDKLEDQRKDQSRKIQLLMNELDEERKKRACMEIEIERLRKLIEFKLDV